MFIENKVVNMVALLQNKRANLLKKLLTVENSGE